MDVTQQVKMYDTARLAVASTSGSRSAASGKVSLELSLLALCMHGGVGIFFAHDEGNGADPTVTDTTIERAGAVMLIASDIIRNTCVHPNPRCNLTL